MMPTEFKWFFGVFLFIMIISILYRIVKRCCCRDEFLTPVVVTSATHTAPGGYPVTTQMPPPGGMPYAQPYPPPQTNMTVTHTAMPMPMGQPPPTGFQPHAAPYPPYPMGTQPPMSSAANMNPPSYESAVGAAGAAPYEKQAPYNPSYAQ